MTSRELERRPPACLTLSSDWKTAPQPEKPVGEVLPSPTRAAAAWGDPAPQAHLPRGRAGSRGLVAG